MLGIIGAKLDDWDLDLLISILGQAFEAKANVFVFVFADRKVWSHLDCIVLHLQTRILHPQLYHACLVNVWRMSLIDILEHVGFQAANAGVNIASTD